MDKSDVCLQTVSRDCADRVPKENRQAELTRRRINSARVAILQRAKAAIWTGSFDAIQEDPDIDVDGMYGLGDAKLTVKVNGALCLKSPNLLIADIDCDLEHGILSHQYPRLDVKECIFQSLFLLDSIAGTDFQQQSYCLYRTCAGYRVICVSKPIEVTAVSLALLRFLSSDPRYAVMCETQQHYRARLTPKVHRVLETEHRRFTESEMQAVYGVIDDWFVCERIGGFHCGVPWYDNTCTRDVHPDLAEQVLLHDDLCLKVKCDAKLA